MERITFLEELKSAAAAAQVRETARLDELRAADETERNVPQGKRGKGLSAEVGLARKASAQRGGQFLGFARALATEMPHTLGALEDGDLTEWRATILVRETAYLTRESREEIDRVVAGDRQALLSMGDRALTARAKELAYELEPRTVVDRKAKAERDRRVAVRPAPDLMAQVSALVPMHRGWRCSPRSHATPMQLPGPTDARGIRSWPTPSSSGSPVRRAPPRCRSR